VTAISKRALSIAMGPQAAPNPSAPGALSVASIDAASGDSTRIGMVCGVAFRREEDFAAFLAPVLEKGFRFGKPAVFPNLLLSSPAGHASIYLGLRGPVFTTSDLSLSTGAALCSAADLLLAGEADQMIASGVVERDVIVERVVGPLTYGPDLAAEPRSPTAVALVLGAEGAAARPLAVLHDWQDGTLLDAWAPAAPPLSPALVVLPRPSEALSAALDRSPWAAARRVIVSRRAGSNEGTAGVALAAGVAALAREEARAVLVVDHWQEPGSEPGLTAARWAAFTLISAT
jgi:3-oxoacyl-[acyl-carrier-protein] synthase II